MRSPSPSACSAAGNPVSSSHTGVPETAPARSASRARRSAAHSWDSTRQAIATRPTRHVIFDVVTAPSRHTPFEPPLPIMVKVWAGAGSHRHRYVKRSLPSLFKSDLPGNARIVLIDDISTDPRTLELMSQAAAADP